MTLSAEAERKMKALIFARYYTDPKEQEIAWTAYNAGWLARVAVMLRDKVFTQKRGKNDRRRTYH